MDWIVITGVKPWDGRYELDMTMELTTREWGYIKRLAGYLPLQVTDEAFGDPELACALAVIAIRRAGRIQPAEVPELFERLADAPFGTTITIESDPEQTEADDAGPPSRSLNGSEPTSGPGSQTSSETSAPTLRGSGIPVSATSEPAPPTSAT